MPNVATKLSVGGHQIVDPREVHDGAPTRTTWRMVAEIPYMSAKFWLADGVLTRHEDRDFSVARYAYQGRGGEGWAIGLAIVVEVNRKVVALWRKDASTWAVIERHQ